MEDYQKRLFDECKELNERKGKLHNFISSNENFKKLSEEKQKLMNEQLDVMQDYENILVERIHLEKFSDSEIYNYLQNGKL